MTPLRPFGKIILLVVSSLVSLAIAEIIVRTFSPQQLIVLRPDIWRPDSLVGWRHQENVSATINSGERPVDFTTDGQGFRVNAANTDTSNPEYRILVLGDSFVEGIAVESQSTIPEAIRMILESRLHRKVRADNAGVAGWDPNQYFLEARQVLSHGSYNLGMVFLFVGNDIVDTEVEKFSPRSINQDHSLRFPRQFSKAEIIDAILYPINDALETRSHLFVLLKNSMQGMLISLGLSAFYFPNVYDKAMATSSCWNVTARICKKIQELFEVHQTPVLFVLLPPKYQVYEGIFRDYIRNFNIDTAAVDMNQPNVLLKGNFASMDMTLVDPTDFLRERSKSEKELYGMIDTHTSAEGHALLAEFLFPFIQPYLHSAIKQN